MSVELRALREALSWTSTFYRGPLVIEMDCLKAITALPDHNCNWAIEEGAVVEDCSRLTNLFDQVKFSHTKREGKRVAHSLAQEVIRTCGLKE